MTNSAPELRVMEEAAKRRAATTTAARTELQPDMYFDRTGRAITLAEYCLLFENADYKWVSYDELGPIYVSTMWLGVDHGFGVGPPLIFETMTFSAEPARSALLGRHFHEEAGIQRRYSTEAEAEAGHAATVAELRGLIAEIGGDRDGHATGGQ